MYFISEYKVDRCYGGPEEGGWWYDWNDFVKVVATATDEDDAYRVCRALNAAAKADVKVLDVVAFLQVKEREEGGERDRYSVIGGADVAYHVEDTPGEDQSTEHPHYE